MAKQELLVKRAQKGDQSAFVELIDQSEQSLYHVAIAILKKDEDCVDAIQDTILKAYQKLVQLKKPKHFQTWLTRILINQCYKIFNQRKKVINLSDTAKSMWKDIRSVLNLHILKK
ncbi:sigma factor [Risungbinella massiliensis]|uniref:sigma factor n=1 Tax=Risungbinella massiliensis TaxID=1329796 RepID=UPI00069A4124|nr:sigma factor [Risungbinella massiliensis]